MFDAHVVSEVPAIKPNTKFPNLESIVTTDPPWTSWYSSCLYYADLPHDSHNCPGTAAISVYIIHRLLATDYTSMLTKTIGRTATARNLIISSSLNTTRTRGAQSLSPLPTARVQSN